MCGYPTAAPGGIARCPEWQRRSVFLNGAHLIALFPPLSAPQRGRLGLTSGRLCWRPALRRPASMSEPRSSRPPWALLSYYSHSSGCCRGFQTSKRTFTLPLSLSLSPLSHTLSLLGCLLFLSASPPLASVWSRCQRSKVAWSVSLGV